MEEDRYDPDEVLRELEESPPASMGHTILRPMVLSLIQSSYLRTNTLTEFARDVFDIVGTAVSVPAAFAEGFLRSFLSIQSVREDDAGRVFITPKAGASEEDIIREVDEIAAKIEPNAVYNPVVRRQMDLVAEATNLVMRQDLEAMAELTPEELSLALKDLEDAEFSQVRPPEPLGEAEALRQRLDRVRESIRAYQVGLGDLPSSPEDRRAG